MILTRKKHIKSTLFFALILLLSGYFLVSCESKREKATVTNVNRSGTGSKDYLVTADKLMLSSEYDSALR